MEANPTLPLWQAVFTGAIGLLYILAGYRTMRFAMRLTSGLLFMDNSPLRIVRQRV